MSFDSLSFRCAMRRVAVLIVSALVLSAGAAFAETKTFVIANQPDGYGVDRCLSSGEPCGQTVARAYCQAQDFAKAASFRRVERDEITGAIPVSSCGGTGCGEFIAITCQR